MMICRHSTVGQDQTSSFTCAKLAGFKPIDQQLWSASTAAMLQAKFLFCLVLTHNKNQSFSLHAEVNGRVVGWHTRIRLMMRMPMLDRMMRTMGKERYQMFSVITKILDTLHHLQDLMIHKSS